MPIELMFRKNRIMHVEWTITSCMKTSWMDQMNEEELLAVRIQQLERRSEDVE